MNLILPALLILISGGISALCCGRRTTLAAFFAGSGTLAAALLTLTAAGRTLLFQTSETLSLPWPVPGGSFTLTLDPLAAFFLVPILLISSLCALYGYGYLKDHAADRPLSATWFFFTVLIAAMILVVTAANAILFIAAWECMSLSSFFLVAFDHRQREVREAAWLYLLSTHLGAAALFALFLFASHWSGSPEFSTFAALGQLAPGPAALLFLLALVGFGSKAGLFPLHVWLPDAHPAAPSHVSALMSGVMIKTGIYGILRVVDFLPPAPAWWGELLMVLGIAGALFGIALAALQQDIKRCLAYSTVENIGLIFLALGLSWFAAARDLPTVAVLAMAGGLLHLWNHALFKSLMFLGAGALLHSAGTRNLDRMGGLLKRMPMTGTLLIGGALAICALPPFNGFVGEWLIYRSLLQAGAAATALYALGPLLLVGLLALVGGLALAVFTRIIGIALLGAPRSPEAASAHEASRWMLWPMALLLPLCLLAGVFPGALLNHIGPLAGKLLRQPELSASLPGLTVLPLERFTLAGLLILAALSLIPWLLTWRKSPRRHTWGCGYPLPTARMSYTATGYGEIIQTRAIPALLQPELHKPASRELFPEADQLSQRSLDPFLHRWFAPVFRAVAERFSHLRWLQQGRLNIYLLYIFLTCALLLGWIALVEKGIL
ncbi:proton-conducting transporter transmembrane domain-containing protein [Trichloromonas sp.]|uniref:proton-conducting transporter transmembrane domain-containing protein n=1 Tax=Trichloromonas sp. TaxID=3069249 RepID=UPI002A3E0B2C|nr:proton-conducting transporter membrane subunit [Trichloromonas sp.]